MSGVSRTIGKKLINEHIQDKFHLYFHISAEQSAFVIQMTNKSFPKNLKMKWALI